jgi:hypothetical protein
MSNAQAFATAVQAVITDLEERGFEIAEASYAYDTTPHIVATNDDGLLFVLVQGLEGPSLAEFNEEFHRDQLLPFIEAMTWHPKGRAVAERAASFDGRAALAMVGLIATDDTDSHGDTTYLTKVFPLRAIDRSGLIENPHDGASGPYRNPRTGDTND